MVIMLKLMIPFQTSHEAINKSKLRYGLALFGKIRWNIEDTTHKEFKDLQINQNKLL